MTPHTHSFFRSLLEWVVIFAIALGLMLVVRTFVFEPFVVPTGSMEDTIEIGDQIFVQKVSLELGQMPEQGEIVVFQSPAKDAEHDILVKRVIAVAGQTVDLKDGQVYVDGEPLDEPYTQGLSWPLASQADGVSISYPYTVPEGCVWMMGDNREHSADSRYFGPVPQENLIGIAGLRYWPLNRIGLL